MKISARALLLGAGVIVGLNLPAQAQEPTTIARRWYVGVGAGAHYYLDIFVDTYGTFIQPGYLYAGARLGPRWAVQLGAQARQQTAHFSNDVEMNGVPTHYQFSERRRNVAVPLLFRRSLSKHPHAVQAEWLIGVTWLSRSLRDETVETQPDKQRTSTNTSRMLGTHLTTGLGLRYAPGSSRVFAEASLQLHKNLRYPPTSVYGLIPGFGASAGLGYAFGVPKAAK